MLNTLDWVVGLVLVIATGIAVFWILIFFVPALLSRLLPNPTARLKAVLAKVEALYGEDKETYNLVRGLGGFALWLAIFAFLIGLTFGREATGSGRFKISEAYQHVYGFFSYLGAHPFWGGVGTFVASVAMVVSTIAGCLQFAEYMKRFIEKRREPGP
jgi:hypothetical protein